MNHKHHSPPASGVNSRWKLVAAVFLAIATFFLLTEHRAHFFGALPYLLLLACPLLHLFHHHGSHGAPGGQRAAPDAEPKDAGTPGNESRS